MTAVLLMKIAFGGGNAFWETVEVALQKLLVGGGLQDCLRLPRLLTTNTRQLEILVTTLIIHYQFSIVHLMGYQKSSVERS